MNDKVRALIKQMLEDYADLLMNHGCNDWDFPASWTTEERADFTRRCNEDANLPIEDEGGLMDFEVATFLARLIIHDGR